jgi:D-alanyl-D-alanine dipeptidase/carboxypeptidase
MIRRIYPEDALHRGDLVLVNRQYPIRREPHKRELETILPGGQRMLRQGAAMLRGLLYEIGAGSAIAMVSGYRSKGEQEALYNAALDSHGDVFTRAYVAEPDASEHQTGLAMDLGEAAPDLDFLRPAFPDRGICGIFRSRMAEFGFIERYPLGKECVTGIAFEPWHIRYVSYPHSMIIRERGLALEEYLDLLSEHPPARPLRWKGRGGWAEISYLPFAGKEWLDVELPDGPYLLSGDNRDGLIVTWLSDGEG